MHFQKYGAIKDFIGIKNVLEYGKKNPRTRIIYVSSSEVYGTKTTKTPLVKRCTDTSTTVTYALLMLWERLLQKCSVDPTTKNITFHRLSSDQAIYSDQAPMSTISEWRHSL